MVASTAHSAIYTLIATVLLSTVTDSSCYPRRYNHNKAGKKGVPTATFSSETIEANGRICTKISKPVKCAEDARCLWLHESDEYEDPYAPHPLEQPTFKNLKYVPSEILRDDDYTEMQHKNFHLGDAKDYWGNLTDSEIKETTKILTFDPDHIMYQYELTDFDDHTQHTTNMNKRFMEWIAKTEGAPFNTSSTRRRLPWNRVNQGHDDPFFSIERDEAPYSSVGLIRIGAAGSATGTIIHITPRVRRAGRNKPYKYIYVLAAAHELVGRRDQHEAYAPLADYHFYPGISATEDGLRIAEQSDLIRVGRLKRAWVTANYADLPTAAAKDRYDIGILKFLVHHTFRFPALTVAEDGAIRVANAPDPAFTRKMIGYDTNFPIPGGPYKMTETDVPIYCQPNSRCNYVGLRIVPGYCGSPIVLPNNNIIAMQVTAGRVNRDDAANACEDNHGDYSNCKGFATRFSAARVTAINHITANDAPGEAHGTEPWQRIDYSYRAPPIVIGGAHQEIADLMDVDTYIASDNETLLWAMNEIVILVVSIFCCIGCVCVVIVGIAISYKAKNPMN